MDKPRILIIDNSVSVTGALKAIGSVAAKLTNSFSFTFIIPKRSASAKWLSDKKLNDVAEWKLVELSKRFTDLVAYVPFLFSNSLRLKGMVKEKKIDLVHVNDLYNLVPAVATMLGCRTPYVCHVRFMPERFPKRLFDSWLRIQLRYAQKIIVVSDALRNKFPPHNKIVTIYDGYAFGQSNVSVSNNRDRFVFLYLSNIIEGKGQDHALQAFMSVADKIPQWNLRFVGGDMGLEKNKLFREQLRSRGASSPYNDRIEWHDFANDVEKEYVASDVVLNFSESESFSMSSLEALACGRPLIVSNSGGPAEIVTADTGILVPNRDIQAMAAAMLRLAGNAALRTEMGLRGAADMRRRFDIETTGKKLAEVYRSCLLEIKGS